MLANDIRKGTAIRYKDGSWNADTRIFERVTFTPAQQKQLDKIATFDKMLGGL